MIKLTAENIVANASKKTNGEVAGYEEFKVSEFSMLGNTRILKKDVQINTGYDVWNAVRYLIDDTPICLVYDNNSVKWRIDTYFEKEPHTLAWIKTFEPGQVFVDIGANIGLYSLWAAIIAKSKVYAFEPDSQNYGILNRNFYANNLYTTQQALAYCCAISDSIKFSKIHITACSAGNSFNDFDERLSGRQTNFVQGCMSVSIDELVSTGSILPPDHIKIDVDGYEHLAVLGCRQVIESDFLKSILVEIDRADENHMAIVEYLTSHGYRYSEDQVEGKRSIPVPQNATTRNYIFFKDEKYSV